MLQRHEVLRSHFAEDASGRPFVVIQPMEEFHAPFKHVDLTAASPEAATDLMQESNDCTFDMLAGPLVSAMLFTKSADSYTLLLNTHHAVMDGWSMRIMVTELLAAYNALARGQQPQLEPLALQYLDYAVSYLPIAACTRGPACLPACLPASLPARQRCRSLRVGSTQVV